MLLYRIIRGLHETFILGVFWVYVAAFFVALALIFVFPPGSIALFFGALVSLPLVVVSVLLLRVSRAGVATLVLRRGVCPCCGVRMLSIRNARAAWRCEFCRACFHPGGREEPVSPASAASQTPPASLMQSAG